MINIGEYNTLEILRNTSVGLYLGCEDGEDILLPIKYMPNTYEIGDRIDVFVYRDSEDRKIATNIDPKIHLGEFALLRVNEVSNVGAFLDWGMEKDLLVPFKEQRQNMEQGRWYVVYLMLDDETDRLYASNKIEKLLSNRLLTVKEEQAVDITVFHESEMGYSVIVNNIHKGLVYKNEAFKELNIGDKLKGFVKKIREENKLDISLQPIGFKSANTSNSQQILQKLEESDGFVALTDKSDPQEISALLGISKKAFKRAIGTLYKERKITIEPNGIRKI